MFKGMKRSNKNWHLTGVTTSYPQEQQRASATAQKHSLSCSARLNMLFGQTWGFVLNTLWNPHDMW